MIRNFKLATRSNNGYRLKLWKYELQKFSNKNNMEVHVYHFPPGTSKWNMIKHRLFSFISMNWKGQPLLTDQIILNLISSTKNRSGLKIETILDKNIYKKGIHLTDEQMEKVSITQSKFHGEWNYIIKPKKG